MKRIIAILICILLLAGCGKAASSGTPATTEAAAAATEAAPTETDPGPEGITEEKDTQTVYLLTRMTVLDANGNESWHRESLYDEMGRVTEEFEYTAGYTLTVRRVYRYSSEGLLEEETAYHMSLTNPEEIEMTLSHFYTYDGQGRVTLIETHENEQSASREEYTYDAQGRVQTVTTYYSGMEAWGYVSRHTYGDSGELLRIESLTGDELMYATEYTYDENGRLSGTQDYEAGEIPSASSQIVWDGNTQTTAYYDMTGALYLTETITYNEFGDPTLGESVYPDGVSILTEYTYEPYEIQK